jgi:hypothetical protein
MGIGWFICGEVIVCWKVRGGNGGWWLVVGSW